MINVTNNNNIYIIISLEISKYIDKKTSLKKL